MLPLHKHLQHGDPRVTGNCLSFQPLFPFLLASTQAPPPPLNEYQKRKFQQDGGRGAGHLTGPKAELGGGRKEHISVIEEALPAQL